MAAPLVTDELWTIIEPHIPAKPRRTRNPGRKPVPNRACLAGILFVLKSGIPWEMLPQEMGCGSGMTCWRRLRDWRQAGVWQTIHHILLDQTAGRRRDRLRAGRRRQRRGARRRGGVKVPAPTPRPPKSRLQAPRAHRWWRRVRRG